MSDYPLGLEDVSGFPKVFQALIDDKVTASPVFALISFWISNKNQTHSWTEAELAGLAGGNMLRVMREVEKLSEELRDAGARPDNKWMKSGDFYIFES